MYELYATLREEWDLEPLPLHEEPPFTPVSRPDLAKEYPLILSTGRRSPAFFHAEHRMIPWLREIDPDPVVEIHPDTAARTRHRQRGVGLGGKLDGKGQVQGQSHPGGALLDGHGRPRLVVSGKAGAEPSLYGTFESNINLLLPMGEQGKDGLGAPIKHSMCRIYK